MGLSAEQRRAALAALATDFELFAGCILRILPKQGGTPVPLIINPAQRFLAAKLEEQRSRAAGKVRAIVLKGRQQGISTYTEARFYHRLTHQRGKRAFILTHEDKATANLFAMVSRFWKLAPPEYRPHLGKSNERELVFDVLDSRYSVATAGAKDTGRSATAQFFHGSEVAFWPHAEQHLAGIGQIVPDQPGTEVIYESTANGTANVFHELWELATSGKSDFMPVFIPWLWQPEYATLPPKDFELDADEEDYMEAYGATEAQMYWRRRKIGTDFRGDTSLFDQEYPASPDVAFASSSPRALIKGTHVALARRMRDLEAIGTKIMAVDPAEYGDDDTAVHMRRGRVARKIAAWHGLGTMETAGRVALLADKEKPDVIVVDATGVGTGVADRIKELGYPVVRVHFGSAAFDNERFVNCRDECWGLMAEWMEDGPVSIEDDDSLAAQLTSVQYGYDSKRRIKLEPKEAMKKRGLRSPDDADSLALTFYRGAQKTGGSTAADYRRLRGHDDDD